jgi:carbon-monoxide dehydrogenase small subunit
VLHALAVTSIGLSQHTLRVTVNGQERSVTVPADRLLIDLLREDLGLTGTKLSCSVGVCGACSVLVDGELLSACLVPAVFVEGASVTTIEGLAPDEDHLTPLQEAFIRNGGFQCGICTPGQIIAATALLNENPRPSVDDIKQWMMGNLCRCTGYYQIIDSIVAACS